MGLDQYLTARRYIGAWQHSENDERKTHDAIMRAIGKADWRCEESPHVTVEVSVGYWRKANQIHAWMVEHVQDGNDDCKSYYVDREQLVELRDLCTHVLASTRLVAGEVVNGQTGTAEGWKDNVEQGQILENSCVAREVLPSTSGFFFGGTDYDEWYWRDLESTVEIIDKALANFGDGDSPADGWGFQYRASW